MVKEQITSAKSISENAVNVSKYDKRGKEICVIDINVCRQLTV